MAIDVSTLQNIYVDSCERHGVLPNAAVLSGFFKAEVKKSFKELCNLEIFLDQLNDIDFPPLLDVCLSIDTSEIEAVDIHDGSSRVLNGDYALSLMRAFNQKLRVVDLQDSLYGKDFLRELSQGGLTCQVLNLRSSRFRKLNMAGEFMRIHTLNLDFNTSLTSFREDCFTCMPNLSYLSMCATRVANLWTTIAALTKLSSLVELRFQKWLCCNETGSSSAPCGGKSDYQCEYGQIRSCSNNEAPSIVLGEQTDFNSGTEETLRNMFSFNDVTMNQEVQSMMEDSSDDGEVDFSTHWQEFDYMDSLSNESSGWNRQVNLQDEVPFITMCNRNEESLAGAFTRHMTDVALKKIDRERAAVTYSQYFEYLPYKRKYKESVVRILNRREIKENRTFFQTKKNKRSYPSKNSQYFYTRSFCAAKVGSSAWPSLHPLSVSGCDLGGGRRSFRPRQFEYHPSISSLLVFGTLDGEVVVVNHENEKIVSYVPSLGAMNSVLGLCWLKRYPSKLIAGSDNGSLKLYDVEHMPPTLTGIYSGAGSVTFDDFDQLTSVHVNATDELFLASGYSKNVALYDINSGRRIQMFTDMHREHINVVKFSNHSPSIFATSSFDHDVKLWDLRQKPMQPCYTTSSSNGNVMVCFSPDDHYLLVSAVDNEVRQLLAVDGRPHLNFEISSTASSQNYTRSYYMNGRDYIISGSCDEHVVRVCCAQTGRRLKDISLEGRGLGTSMYVQSLRGDPFRDFNLSILAAYMRPNSKYEIVKVNLLASCDRSKECSYSQHSQSSNGMGG
ncbi:hypothetical protein GH714_032380 [Hevea brasiliensis]|uniref:DWD hypersensitive to UV-B 1 N-terminal domain-containing protein n=1 Tax=Hevea brasiliensis TaxID=3981 RepID=A0A6A6N9U1_HEVBR|nr:hypothetical protein GH714_032380 [Hevea brasiliensis]